MYSRIRRRWSKTAAWRLSAWSSISFSLASAATFGAIYWIVASNVAESSDAWLTGEAGVLAEVADTTPEGELYGRLVREAAELATHEVPPEQDRQGGIQSPVFFLEASEDGTPLLWVGPQAREPFLSALQRVQFVPGVPRSIRVAGRNDPFRVVLRQGREHHRIFLGLSHRHAFRLLNEMSLTFFLSWLAMSVIGFVIAWSGAHRILGRVEAVTRAADQIGTHDLSLRVAHSGKDDEISHLTHTFNLMLDRIQSSVDQIRSLSDALAHDLRSTVTSVRGTLEAALTHAREGDWHEPVALALERLDRLSSIVNATLDVAEAEAGALRLNRETVDYSRLVREMVDLYRPLAAEKGVELVSQTPPRLEVEADVGLLTRALANLMDNEVTHLPPGSHARVELEAAVRGAELTVTDDGPGFPPELGARVFDRFTKGSTSQGFGIGLSFVRAVMRAHGGDASIVDSANGAGLSVTLPFEAQTLADHAVSDPPWALSAGSRE